MNGDPCSVTEAQGRYCQCNDGIQGERVGYLGRRVVAWCLVDSVSYVRLVHTFCITQIKIKMMGGMGLVCILYLLVYFHCPSRVSSVHSLLEANLWRVSNYFRCWGISGKFKDFLDEV